MGVIERKEREKEEMRQSILGAARKLFLEQGYEKTSIRNIAEAIEYSPGTIYLYYKDKSEIIFALHNESFGVMMAYFQSIASIEDPFERLVAMGRKYLDFAFENPELYELMFLMKSPIETLECRSEIWEHGHLATGMLKMIIADCVQAGYFKNTDIEAMCMTIWSGVHGLATLHVSKRTTMYQEDERVGRIWAGFEMMVKMLRYGL
ncbi:MAG: TetR/AcrR family transcriptional regulator [Spirosomataceae bacterium]